MIPIRVDPKDTIYIFGFSDASVELLFKLKKEGYAVKLVCQPAELDWESKNKIGDGFFVEAFKDYEYFIKHNRMGDVVFALCKSEWDNEIILKALFDAGVPYRVSLKPYAYSNSILPKQVTRDPFVFDIQSAGANTFLNERMAQDLNKALETIDFKKYRDLVSIIDRAQRNPGKYKEEAELVSSLGKLDERELWGEVTRIAKKLTKRVVIGFEDTEWMRERAKRAKEILERENPGSEVRLKGYSSPKNTQPPESIKDFVHNAKNAYLNLAQRLSRDEISFALIDPSFLYWDSKRPVNLNDLESKFGMVENVLPRKYSKDYVISANKGGVDWNENKIHIIHYKDFYRINEMRSYFDYNRFSFTESHTEDFLKGKYKLSEDEYVIISEEGLESLGLTLDELTKNGLNYSTLDFPYPIGYGRVNGLYKKDDLTASEILNRVKSLSFPKETARISDFCFRAERQIGEFCQRGLAYGTRCYSYVTIEPDKEDGVFKVSYMIVTENYIFKKSLDRVELDSDADEFSLQDIQNIFLL